MAGMYDLTPGLNALSGGLDSIGDLVKNYTAQQQLAALGDAVKSGDYGTAANAAIKSGQINLGLNLLQLDRQQKFLSQPPDPSVATGLTFGGGDTPTFPAVTKPAPVGGFDNAFKRTMSFEVDPSAPDKITTDNNQAPVKYGINAEAHPNVDLASLDMNQARDIYKKQYWDALGLDNVDPRLAHVIFDTAVNHGQDTAQRIMDASGGDVNKALALRQADYSRLLATGNPKYTSAAPAWNTRVQSLRADVNAPGGGAQDSRVVAQGDDDTEDSADTAKINTLRGQRNWLLQSADRLSRREALGDPGAKSDKEILLKKYDDLGHQLDKLTPSAKQPTSVKRFTDQDYADWGKDPQIDGVWYYKDGVPTPAGGERAAAAGGFKIMGPGAVAVAPDREHPGQLKELFRATPAGGGEAIKGIVDRHIAGDPSALTGLSKSNRDAVAAEISRRMVDDPTIPDQIIQNRAKASGTVAGARTSGQILARVHQYVGEAENAFNIAEQTSSQLPRTQYTTPNRILQMAQSEMNDPRLSAHSAAINSAVNTYAKAMNAAGQPTDTARAHAYEVLNKVQSPEAFGAALNVLRWEMKGAAHTANDLWGGKEAAPGKEPLPIGSPNSATGQSQSVVDTIGGMLGMNPANPAPTQFKTLTLPDGTVMRQVR